jgi:hypothetical protein
MVRKARQLTGGPERALPLAINWGLRLVDFGGQIAAARIRG